MDKHIIILFILINVTIVSPSGDSTVTTFVRVPDEQWQEIQDKVVAKDDNIQLLLVTQHTADEKENLKQTIDKVSDPASAHYGQYLSYDQVYQSILSKTTSMGDTLEKWIEKNGIKIARSTKYKEFIIIEAPVNKTEYLFKTKLNLYRHKKTGKKILRATKFELPLYIRQCVAYIVGLDGFPVIPDKKPKHNIEKPLGNAPIIYSVRSGFSKYSFSIQLVCSNGKKASNSLCENKFNGYEITISKISKPFQVSVHEANCQICSNATSLIALYCNSLGLSEDAVYCRFYLNQENSIPLYQPHNFSIRTKFRNGLSDAAKYQSALEKVIDITPPVLRSLYNVNDSSISKPNKASRQAIAGFDEYLDMKSFKSFAQKFGKKFPLVFGKVYGSNYSDPQNDELETSLDIQYMASMGSPIPTDYISSPGHFDDFLIDFFVQLALLEQNKKNVVPLVYSISYADDELDVGRLYIDICETQFGIHTLTGKTFFAGSGDDGVSSYLSKCQEQFHPYYPASSAYVTSVGATQFIKATSGCPRKLNNYCLEEVVAAKSIVTGCRITSGGGFSYFISRPNYQKASVANYLKLAKNQLPPKTYFNQSNRAYPDISLVGHQYLIKVYGKSELFVDGTSASSPALAGLISLVVNQRLKMGKKPLGLLNPLLYSIAAKYPTAFHDVTKGNIKCNTSPTCCKYGFVAKKYWDPTTGWGSINHEILMEKLIMA